MPVAPGVRLGVSEIVELLGSGGMGTIQTSPVAPVTVVVDWLASVGRK